MIKIFLNRKPFYGPYGGGIHFVNNFFKYAPQFGIEPTNDLNDNINGILVVDPRKDELGVGIREVDEIKFFNKEIKVIHRVNECDKKNAGANNIDKLLRDTSNFSDLSIFVSKWVQELHSEHWLCDNQTVIHNGCDAHPYKKLTDNKLRIVIHHWSDNERKGLEIYKQIDKFVGENPNHFSFTYIGRLKEQLKNSIMIGPLSGEDLWKELSNHDIGVNASVFDPFPNTTLELIACGLPTYVDINGGGSVECAGIDHTFSSWEELKNILWFTHIGRIMELNKYKPISWEESIKKYCDSITNLF
jgi:glycosyltransferase involved in cell wall biosynthesis